MSEFVVNIDESNAQRYLIEESQARLVVVDFWADWCGPCKSLMPILENLASQYAGQFLLAKVNADEQAAIASQFGVRSLPTVVLMRDGQPLDGFMGAQPETAIREMLDKHLPKPWDTAVAQAQELLTQEDVSGALPLLRDALQQAEQQGVTRSDIALLLAQTYLQLNRVEEARRLVDEVPMVDQDAVYDQVKAQVELKQEAAKSPEIAALEAKLNEDSDNLSVAYQLAIQFSQDGHHREALELLFSILQRDLNFDDGAVKKTMMDVLASLGKGDPLAVEFQRKVFTLMY
ncbi:chaperedoxin [Aurantivibrio plasticivorans]